MGIWQVNRVHSLRGPAALSGGIVLVGLALFLVTELDLPAGVGVAASGDRDVRQLEAPAMQTGQGRSAIASPVAVGREQVDPLVQSAKAAHGEAQDGGPWPGPYSPQVHTPSKGSAASWMEFYQAWSVERLQEGAASVVINGGDSERVVGFLRAIENHGALASRGAFLRATQLSGNKPGLSIPSFAVARLVDAAEDPETRVTLAQFAWDRHPKTAIRLRCRAVAALVTWAQPDEYTALHDQLWRELEPAVLASAFGAARASNPDLQQRLSGLDPSFDWTWKTPANEGQSGLKDH